MIAPITIRPFDHASDAGLVVTSWVGSHRASARWLSREEHDRLLRYAVKRALDEYTVLVATHPEHPEYLFGWICASRGLRDNAPLLHYVFVKSKFRRQGIARQLLTQALPTCVRAGLSSKTKYTSTSWSQDGQHLRSAGFVDVHRPDLFNPGGAK